MAPIVIIIAICSLLPIANSELFSEIKPLLYRSTNFMVAEGFDEYHTQFMMANPCAELPSEMNHIPNKLELDMERRNNSYETTNFNRLYEICRSEYSFLIKSNLRLLENAFKNNNLPRGNIETVPEEKSSVYHQKRHDIIPFYNDSTSFLRPMKTIVKEETNWPNIDPSTLLKVSLRKKRGLGDVLNIINQAANMVNNLTPWFVVTNLITTVFMHVKVNHDIRSMEHELEKIRTTINIREQYSNEITKQLNAHESAAIKKMMELETQFHDYTRIHRFQEILIERFRSVARDIERLIEKVNNNKMDITFAKKHLKLHKVGLPSDLREDQTYITHVQVTENINEDYQILNIVFKAPRNVEDTKIYSIETFDHWIDLDETEKFVKYDGPRHIAFNHTNNCGITVDLNFDSSKSLFLRCEEDNYLDPDLSTWTEQFINNSTDRVKSERRQILFDSSYYYLYCFPNNITINNMLITCPTKPIKIPNLFNVTGKGIKLVNRRIENSVNLTKNVMYEDVHIKHFLEAENDNDIKFYNAVKKYQETINANEKKINELMKHRDDLLANVSDTPIKMGVEYVGIGTIVITTLIITIYITCVVSRSKIVKSISKRFKKKPRNPNPQVRYANPTEQIELEIQRSPSTSKSSRGLPHLAVTSQD